MPGMDGTGPMGLGPGTGWGRGRCGFGGRPAFGFGYGRRFGCWGPGPGWWPRRRFWGFGPVPGPASEKEALEQQKAWLEQELEAINQRLASLTSSSS